MLTTWDQRQRRDKIKVTRRPVSSSGETGRSLPHSRSGAITPQTQRAAHLPRHQHHRASCFPFSACAGWRGSAASRSIVDAAHSVAHFPFKLSELECDFRGHAACTNGCWRHTAPGCSTCVAIGIKDAWPLQAAAATQNDNIRKFEQVGTQSVAPKAAAIAEALRVSPGDRHREQGGAAAIPRRPAGPAS